MAFGHPVFSSFSISFGKTVSELEVEYAKSNSSFNTFIILIMLEPTTFAIVPRTTKTKKIIAPYTRSINLPKGINDSKPNLETDTPINPNTPTGANFIMKFVTQNIASAVPWKNASTGLPLSPIAATPNPNNTEKKITGNISPSAIDWIMLLGTIPTMTSIIPSFCTLSDVSTYSLISVLAREDISIPLPG